jgi:hypothetical protein
MALIDVNKLESYYKDKDSGLRIDTPDGVKAITISGQPGPSAKSKRHKHNWWPEEKKLEAATLYVATGNYNRTSKLTKIPEKTIRRWALEDWWMQTIQRVRREESAVTDKKFSTIVDKALDKLQERIEGGDYVYDIRKGVAVPVPMSGRDLAIVTGTIFDKRQLLRGEATKITAGSTSEEHLKKLASEFTQFVQDKLAKKAEKVITGEVVDEQ